MKASDVLNQAADVLEKTAAYIEGIESKNIADATEIREKAAQNLAEKISAATGEQIDTELAEKLSSMGPEVQDILGRLTDGGLVDSMGDAEDTTKLASVEGGLPIEDARFLAWVQS